MESEDLDDILDSALDELDDEDEEGEEATKSSGENASSGGQVLSGAGEPSSARAAGSAAPVGTAKEGEGGAGSGRTQEGGVDAEPNIDEKELQETIAKTIEMLGRTNLEAGQGGAEDGAMFDEAFLSELASEFERLGSEMREGGAGGGQNEDRIVDDMVKHLLCKELMYPPLKQVTDAYPAWLARPESKQNQEEYDR
jgi:peroxin-19